VVTSIQWGDNLLFWVGDKAIGGKMFCLLNLEPGQKCVAAFAASPEGFAELCEREDISPAPYLARAHWVCVQQWQALSWAEWKHLLTAAHAIVHARLPARTRAMLALPAREQARLVRARKPDRK
jgi:predicted DNA-binding protein (MmcQ/YjbR family)